MKQDFTAAFQLYSSLAGRGSAEADYNLATMFYLGQGTLKDRARAFRWYMSAADLGFAQAEFNVGACLVNGEGAQKNLTAAAYWFARARDHGDRRATNELHRLIDQGVPGAASFETRAQMVPSRPPASAGVRAETPPEFDERIDTPSNRASSFGVPTRPPEAPHSCAEGPDYARVNEVRKRLDDLDKVPRWRRALARLDSNRPDPYLQQRALLIQQLDVEARIAEGAFIATCRPGTPLPEWQQPAPGVGSVGGGAEPPPPVGYEAIGQITTVPRFGLWPNRYDPNSINNPYGAYGSPYSAKSVNNPYATDAPRIFARDGHYLGKLSANPFDPDSTSNPYGRYGSAFSSDSINNPFGPYGSPFSPLSPNNPYTTQLPVLVDTGN